MDIISHGLRGGIAFGRKNKKQFWLSFAFGILPDFVAFGFPVAALIFGMIFLWWSRPTISGVQNIPGAEYIGAIYTVSHSLVVRAAAFLLMRLIFRKPVRASFARLFHILLDIPTHSLAFYATPFLRPISNYRVNGIPRSNAVILYPDIALLIIVYGIYRWRKYRKKKHSLK